MPRVVVFSDIHGNLPALEAVWSDIQRRKPDHVLCLGDLVAFGPQPVETLEFLLDEIKPTALIRGNTDRYLVEEIWTRREGNPIDSEILDSLAWTAEQLGPERINRLRDLAVDAQVEVDGVLLYLCHAAPGDDEKGILRGKLHLHTATIEELSARAVLCGHTHLPFRTLVGETDVLNVGSVGFPFDRDFRPCYLSFFIGDQELQEISFCRVSYGRARVLDRLSRCGMPGSTLFAHRLITATFERPKGAD